ncbi:hypothetical protein RB195_013881 [Necator americanus]|uniref:Uncharacterized protein n=1 Tax=Necator americanus TaxID=51031 RepID=A0ABR1DXK2_NECAM
MLKTLAQLVFLAFTVPCLSHSGFFIKLFTDSGLEISCPSGNPIYINPVSADLQQCHQQLGVYNETTCPGGTVCERFPILVPEFQDYCCWETKTPTEEDRLGGKTISPEEIPPFSRRGAPDRGVVKGIVERPRTVVSTEDEIEEVGEMEDRERGSVKAIKPSPSPSEEDESEWENEPTKRTRRPRGKKVTATTTQMPEPTTKKPAPNHRLPQCNNPDESVFIDYGNRLRDCYFQQCGRGYRCEFNKYIRRFICCGQDSGIVPPPGLPMIPAPKPLNPRPFRPPQRPFQMLSDGEIDVSDGPRYRSKSSCCEENDCNDYGGRQWERGCKNTRCPDGQNYVNCRGRDHEDDLGVMERRGSPVNPDFRGAETDFQGNECNMKHEKGNRCPFSQSRVEMSRGNIQGLPLVRGDLQSMRGPEIFGAQSQREVVTQAMNKFSPMTDLDPQPFEQHRMIQLPSKELRPLPPRVEQVRSDEEFLINALPPLRREVTQGQIQSPSPRGRALQPFHKLSNPSTSSLQNENGRIQGTGRFPKLGSKHVLRALTYASETWALRKQEENALSVTERSIESDTRHIPLRASEGRDLKFCPTSGIED